MAYKNPTDPSDLANLFQHSLQLQPNPSTPAAQFHFPSSTPHYASQHYTHPTFHQNQTQSPSNSSTTSSTRKGYDEDTLSTILRRHSINPTLLSQAQIVLFEIAGHDEQLRLLELWRTSPMTASDLATQFGETSLRREECGARERFERAQQALMQAQQRMEERRLKERSDSFDFEKGQIHCGYGRMGESAEVVFAVGREEESGNRSEAWRGMDGSQMEQRMHGLMNGAAEYDDGMEL